MTQLPNTHERAVSGRCRHPGGLRLVDAQFPCRGCGSTALVQHLTFRCCAACGRELAPEECPRYAENPQRLKR